MAILGIVLLVLGYVIGIKLLLVLGLLFLLVGLLLMALAATGHGSGRNWY